MTHAYDERQLADVPAESASATAGSAAPKALVAPPTVEPAPGWRPVLLPGTPEREGKQSRNRVKRTDGSGRGLNKRRLGGLDGLRAIAVLSVVLFHLDFSLSPGGFLGVDVFFVISGFLITNLLAKEILETGRLRLGAFYWRRARRLLPTVLALLFVVSVASYTVWRDQLATLKSGVLSSLTYVTNWWLIADHQSYFVSSGRPTMLQHLWSLAIEEQFYIVWSLVVIGIAVVVLGGRNVPDSATRVRWVVVTAAALATASAMAMSVFAEEQDLPYGGSTSRVYFGSDTHTTGLFLGAAAGAWLALRHRERNPARLGRRFSKRLWLSDGVGAGALVVLVYEFFAVNEFSPTLYRGGFLAFDIIVLVAILAATRSGSIFGRILDMRPLRWLGRRSYAIYIWHWPVCVVTRPDVDVHGSTFLINLARLALILALSALSYRFVEVPLRIGRRGTWHPDRDRRAEIVAVLITLATAGALALAANPVSAAPTLPLTGPPPAHNRAPTQSTPPSPHHSQHPSPAHKHPKTKHGKHQKPTKTPLQPSLSAYGDSVLLGAGPRLSPHLRHLDLDAVEGRQAYDVLNDIVADARHHKVRPYVLIHIGDNGIIAPSQLDYVLHELKAAKRVVLMTVRVPREWQDPNNNTIRSVGHRYANVDIVDWHAMASAHPEWVYSDGIHLTSAGAVAYTHIVMSALH